MRIAVCGFDGVGKSFLAKALGEHYKCQGKNLAFADGVRMELASLCPMVPVNYWWTKPTPSTVRSLLISHGELQKQLFGDDYWVSRLAKHIQTLGYESMTIGDMRFFAEAEWFRSIGGLIVYLGDHTTEYGLDSCWHMADLHFPAKPDVAEVIYAIDLLCNK